MAPGRFDREAEARRVAAFHATLTWIPLTTRYPDSGDTVLVRMADGVVHGGHWDLALARWRHSPFDKWGDAVEWAALAPLGPGPDTVNR